MSSFTAAFVFVSTDDFEGANRIYENRDPMRYYVGAEGYTCYVDVPPGFRTDLASIPRLLRWLLSPDGLWAQAAVVHDLAYQEQILSRAVADDILREAMGVIDAKRRSEGKPGIALWQRLAIYYGVRIGGWVPYRRYARAKRS